MVITAETGLRIAEHGVEPVKLWQFLRLAAADHGGLVRAVRHGDRAEACKAVGVHRAAVNLVLTRPVPLRSERTPRSRGQLYQQQQLVLGQGYRSYVRDLVLRSPAGFAAASFPAGMGTGDLHRALQPVALFLFAYGSRELVVDTPAGRVADPQWAIQGHQGRGPGLGLAQQPVQRGTSSQEDPLRYPRSASSRGGHRDPGAPTPGLPKRQTCQPVPVVAPHPKLDTDRSRLAQPNEGAHRNPSSGGRSGGMKKRTTMLTNTGTDVLRITNIYGKSCGS